MLCIAEDTDPLAGLTSEQKEKKKISLVTRNMMLHCDCVKSESIHVVVVVFFSKRGLLPQQHAPTTGIDKNGGWLFGNRALPTGLTLFKLLYDVGLMATSTLLCGLKYTHTHAHTLWGF